MNDSYDLAIVGGGILGLGHALAAHRRGWRTVVIDRDAQANGASVRNFGFVTVTGQQAGACWTHARRSRDIWAEVAPQAGIAVEHAGLVLTAQRPEAEAVLDAFAATDMGEGCQRLTAAEALERVPALNPDRLRGALYSPHELRVESRQAVPLLAAWLEQQGVAFRCQTAVRATADGRVETADGMIRADRVVVCPGDDFRTLFPDRIAACAPTRCKLHMLRLVPETPFRLDAAVMSDLSLVRYLGYSELPEAGPLLDVLRSQQPQALANGVHLIVVQSGDGSLVVGDSHHYAATPDPFQPEAVDRLITDEFDAMLRLRWRTAERWIGTYASAPGGWLFRDSPDAATRIVIVTAGCGASTAFSVAEETLSTLD